MNYKTVGELRSDGYAVIIWTPEELGDCPPDRIEEISIERGWELLNEHYNLGNNDEN
jgi:hypothetical protein